ncbi:putative pentatricopeptide repeat-containing protein At3g15200 [Sesamum indicum]|uniref:Pentatricopeptide repeat-containing protein At3g15200 n=1 Tax=Sesamum indicum TaxID=4182 RepID=A0A6I9TDI2_SESIN|nr:putative pentatricopeptide repeat-containing protein At3g15200 [Sesamum indicum]
MHRRFRLPSLQIHSLLSLHSSVHTPFISRKFLVFSVSIQHYHQINPSNFTNNHKPTKQLLQNAPGNTTTDNEALNIQTLLKIHCQEPIEGIGQRLDECNLSLSEDLILNVLKRHRSDWKPAYAFFIWVCRTKRLIGFLPGTTIYNEILDILGRMKRFKEFLQVLDEMSRRKNLINERTYGIVVSRFSAAHKVDEAIEFFNKIEDFGLERNLVAFQTLLLSLCRYKHVEEAEVLFRNKKSEFRDDIKTWNIILNGWCVLRSLPDAKRFWKDIIASECQPDKFTYGIFINSLSKSGKISTAVKLLRTMWEKGCRPDVAICNTVIDGLCFKKRIPEALQIFSVMNERDCSPNVATYNSLIKHLCKIRRMDKVHELLHEMEKKGESCAPNDLTYGYLLKAAKKPEEVDGILERMEKSGCKLQADTYNLVLRLFMEWGDEGRLKYTWNEMERSGLGPDQRSYTIIIHGLYDKGKIEYALEYFVEMMSKGMVPESRTKLLVDEMNFKLKESERLGAMGLKNWQQGKKNR